MAQTYSQSLTGVNANARYNAPKTVQVGDVDIAGNALASDHARDGLAMRGGMVLCKNPDGSQSYYTIDAERSYRGQIIMRPV
jgi:hypothetical protein